VQASQGQVAYVEVGMALMADVIRAGIAVAECVADAVALDGVQSLATHPRLLTALASTLLMASALESTEEEPPGKSNPPENTQSRIPARSSARLSSATQPAAVAGTPATTTASAAHTWHDLLATAGPVLAPDVVDAANAVHSVPLPAANARLMAVALQAALLAFASTFRPGKGQDVLASASSQLPSPLSSRLSSSSTASQAQPSNTPLPPRLALLLEMLLLPLALRGLGLGRGLPLCRTQAEAMAVEGWSVVESETRDAEGSVEPAAEEDDDDTGRVLFLIHFWRVAFVVFMGYMSIFPPVTSFDRNLHISSHHNMIFP